MSMHLLFDHCQSYFLEWLLRGLYKEDYYVHAAYIAFSYSIHVGKSGMCIICP